MADLDERDIMMSMESLQYVPSLERIARSVPQAPGDTAFIVGISGYGGSGKSTLAGNLAPLLVGAAVVGIDEFGSAAARRRSSDWAGLDRARLIDEVLRPVRAGTKVLTYASCDNWDTWATHPVTLEVGRFLIVEGVGLFHPDVLPYLDHRIWLDVDLETATRRGIHRNPTPDSANEWTRIWAPNEVDFEERFAPRGSADVLVALR